MKFALFHTLPSDGRGSRSEEFVLEGNPRREALPQAGHALGLRGQEVVLLVGIGAEVEERFAVAGGLEDILPAVFANPEEVVVHARHEEGALGTRAGKEAVALPGVRDVRAEDVGHGGIQVHMAADGREPINAWGFPC